jgi:hypothetical protein
MYYSWRNMKGRCNRPSHPAYKWYGAKGVTYDPKWETFAGFSEDMGDSYIFGLTIDRIDPQGNYTRGNCRWATPKQQANNKLSNRRLSFNGRSMNLAQWADELGMDRRTLSMRFNLGWGVERALTTPLRGWSHGVD